VTVHAVRTGEAVRHHQEIIRRPDGTALPVLLSVVALDAGMIPYTEHHNRHEAEIEGPSDPSGERIALVVLQDVTALKEAERVKDEFITIAAHELKTPMTAVKGYTEMLLRRSTTEGAGELVAWQADALETIDQATGRLVELTEDLLDVARLQAGRVELHLEPHDLVALARRVAKRLQFSAEHHSLTVESGAEYVVALLDVRRLEQVVGNLLSNAIKYSPQDGPITITVCADSARNEAVLTVRDHGIGIPMQQQGRIFARFARADNARAAGIGGTGLGLYLSRELLERHHGRIWFESVEGEGSAFSIALPLAADDDDDEDGGASPHP
jgi:signal transduction histidine kinase